MKFFKRLFVFCFILGLIGFGVVFFTDFDLSSLEQYLGDSRLKEKAKAEEEKKFEKVNPFQEIDDHARTTPDFAEESLDALADYLSEIASTDLEKSRAIYVWLTDNISYDDDSYNSGVYGDCSANGVLKSRKSVCAGFADLYFELGKRMGLEIKNVSGYSKGYSYNEGDKFSKTNHAWNVIKIDGEWRVFDATWGEGSGKNIAGNLVSTKEFSDYWFNTDPYEAIFTHMPEDPKLAYVSPEISLREYEMLPYVSSTYFEIGYDGKSVFKEIIEDPSLKFPKCYTLKYDVEVKQAPQYKSLELDQNYTFKIASPQAIKVALVDSEKNWTYLEEKDGLFKVDYKAVIPGELGILIQYEKGESFLGLMDYEVEGMDFMGL